MWYTATTTITKSARQREPDAKDHRVICDRAHIQEMKKECPR